MSSGHGQLVCLSSCTLVDRPSLSNPPSKIVAHKLCIAMHHQWVASYPSIASVPGRFTQRGYLLPISGWHRAHPLRSKKHPSGSYHTNPLLTIMRWFTIMVTSTSPHTRIIRVTTLHFHVASNRSNSDGSAVHFGLTPTSTSSYTVKKKNSICTAASQQSQTNGATVSDCPNETHVHQMVRPSILDSRQRPSPRTHSLFVRWFGRPFGLTPTSTHRFLVYIQRKARLVLLHRSASQTNGSTVSDCPNETRVHRILFQSQ
jgi:hypothetical protein